MRERAGAAGLDTALRAYSTGESGVTTAHITDGCVRAGVEVRCAPAGTAAITPGTRLAGRVLPVRHSGSVDIFLEALEHARPGDVLVVDNDSPHAAFVARYCPAELAAAV